jgi:hypothetical protein
MEDCDFSRGLPLLVGTRLHIILSIGARNRFRNRIAHLHIGQGHRITSPAASRPKVRQSDSAPLYGHLPCRKSVTRPGQQTTESSSLDDTPEVVA